MRHTILSFLFLFATGGHQAYAQPGAMGGCKGSMANNDLSNSSNARSMPVSNLSTRNDGGYRSDMQERNNNSYQSAHNISRNDSYYRNKEDNMPAYSREIEKNNAAYNTGNNYRRSGSNANTITYIHNVDRTGGAGAVGQINSNNILYGSKRCDTPRICSIAPGCINAGLRRQCAANILYGYRCRYSAYDLVCMGRIYPSDRLGYSQFSGYRAPGMFNVLFKYMEGYIVYGCDTLYGNVALTHDGVYFGEEQLEYEIPYKDKTLLTVVVYGDNIDPLFITRIHPGDKLLSRVLHQGKLTIYDNDYSFITAGDIDYTQVKIAYGRDRKIHSPLVVLDTRARLVRAVNRAYGTDLKPQEYSIDDLFDHIRTLD